VEAAVRDGVEGCRDFFVLTNPVPNASAVVFRRDAYEKAGGSDERLRLCGDYKVWAAIACQGKMAFVADPLNYYRSHQENVRTRTQRDLLGLAEFFYGRWPYFLQKCRFYRYYYPTMTWGQRADGLLRAIGSGVVGTRTATGAGTRTRGWRRCGTRICISGSHTAQRVESLRAAAGEAVWCGKHSLEDIPEKLQIEFVPNYNHAPYLRQQISFSGKRTRI